MVRAAQLDVRLYEEWEDNVYFHHEFEGGDVDGAFRQAAGLIRRRFTTQSAVLAGKLLASVMNFSAQACCRSPVKMAMESPK